MEEPVIGIHLIIIRRIFLPDLMRLHSMESSRMIQIKLLHMSDFKNACIEILYPCIPEHRPALFHCIDNDVHIDRLVNDVRHQLLQNALVDARKNLCADQFFNRELAEPARQAQFSLHIPRNGIKLPCLIGVHPLGHEVVTVALMRNGDKAVQAHQIIHLHSACHSSHQNMAGKPAEIRPFLAIACHLRHHLPEDLVHTEFD